MALVNEYSPQEVDFHEIHDKVGLYRWVAQYRGEPDDLVVVCESFVPRGGAITTQQDAPHIIGWLEGECALEGHRLYFQTPGQAKSFASSAKLKACGLWPKGLGHAQDAGRHLLTFLCTNPVGRAEFGGEALIRKIAREVL